MEQLEDGRRVIIEGVKPEIDGGRFPIKRVVEERVIVEADIFADGHDTITALLLYRREGVPNWIETRMEFLMNDRWRGSFVVTELGRYLYTIMAWVDRFKSWRQDFQKRVEAGHEDININLLVGANLIAEASARASKADAETMREWVKTLQSSQVSSKSLKYPSQWLHRCQFLLLLPNNIGDITPPLCRLSVAL